MYFYDVNEGSKAAPMFYNDKEVKIKEFGGVQPTSIFFFQPAPCWAADLGGRVWSEEGGVPDPPG